MGSLIEELRRRETAAPGRRQPPQPDPPPHTAHPSADGAAAGCCHAPG